MRHDLSVERSLHAAKRKAPRLLISAHLAVNNAHHCTRTNCFGSIKALSPLFLFGRSKVRAASWLSFCKLCVRKQSIGTVRVCRNVTIVQEAAGATGRVLSSFVVGTQPFLYCISLVDLAVGS